MSELMLLLNQTSVFRNRYLTVFVAVKKGKAVARLPFLCNVDNEIYSEMVASSATGSSFLSSATLLVAEAWVGGSVFTVVS